MNDALYVTDGGRNLVWRIDRESGAFAPLVVFPNIPNPLFPAVGPPTSEAVPTGIAVSDEELLVTLFRGVPFAPGTSTVERVDPETGSHAALISALKTAIDVLPIGNVHKPSYLVLQHASIGPFFAGPGLLSRFETPVGNATLIASCLIRPTAMALDEKNGTLYVTELAGPLVAIPIPKR